jgi:uncharacterized protein YbaA (DUF1428 family)
MAKYVDAFVLPVPKKKLKEYKRIATLAGKVWREHGALEYRECVGEDLAMGFGVPFPKLGQEQDGRDRLLLLDRLQVAGPPGCGE